MSWWRCTTWPASSSHIACNTPWSTTLCLLWKLITTSQVGSSLARGERLSKCPRCESPVRTVKDRGSCTSQQCDYDVCVVCEMSYHAPAPCQPLARLRRHPATAAASIGSRSSRKRLERLCRWWRWWWFEVEEFLMSSCKLLSWVRI